MSKFDYGKAQADLDASGCPDPEEIYEYRSEKGINDFMRSNGLDPDKYRSGGDGQGSSGSPGSSGSSGSSGCFLTTACVRAKGLPGDCYELQVLRAFRDNYLANRPGGREDIEEYYEIAPGIVETIDAMPNAEEEWCFLYDSLVAPCVSLIETGRYEEAYDKYKTHVLAFALM